MPSLNSNTNTHRHCESCNSLLTKRPLERPSIFNKRKYCNHPCYLDAFREQQSTTRHGHSRVGQETPTYKSWRSMRRRCEDPKHDKFSYYGGRGITACSRWADFRNFLADMGERPEGMSIERKDRDGNYEPDNCYWATKSQQMRNKSDNLMLTYNNRTQCAAAWSEETGIRLSTIQYRAKAGWNHSRVLTQPVRQMKAIA